MRNLTSEEIEKLASRKGAKRVAVENFLMSAFYENTRLEDVFGNLDNDTRSYKWNSATYNAIKAGILLSTKPVKS